MRQVTRPLPQLKHRYACQSVRCGIRIVGKANERNEFFQDLTPHLEFGYKTNRYGTRVLAMIGLFMPEMEWKYAKAWSHN